MLNESWGALLPPSVRAPECFNSTLGGMTTKCDVFSFGVILWELATQTRPWEELNEFQVGIDQNRITNHAFSVPPTIHQIPSA